MFWSKKSFQANDIPDLTGKVAIVTGSTKGIGNVSAFELARKNCTVLLSIIAARDKTRAEATVEEIRKETKNDKVEFIEINLCSLASVKKFAHEFKSRYDNLHILLNNAGISSTSFRLTEDGIEMQMATNHVAHYYLTMLLLPVLESSAPSRVVVVSSEGHRFLSFTRGGFDCEKFNDEEGYSGLWQYGASKAANIMFTIELARRLKEKGVEVYVNAVHPGTVKTSMLLRPEDALARFLSYFVRYFAISPEKGALSPLYVATSPDIETKKITGKYYVPVGHQSNPSSVTTSEENIAKLWEWTENTLKTKAPGYEGAPI